MTIANQEYFFIDRKSEDNLPHLTPNEDTAWRLTRSWKTPEEGSAPYIFHNGALDYQKGSGITPLKKLPDVMVGTFELFLSEEKFAKFESLNLPDVAPHPCIYIDHNENWHEGMWHVAIVRKIDCWSRELSRFKPESAEETPDGTIYRVKRYYLDDVVLDKIPLSERLIFRLGGVKYGGTLVHKSLKNLLGDYGVDFIPIEEYRL